MPQENGGKQISGRKPQDRERPEIYLPANEKKTHAKMKIQRKNDNEKSARKRKSKVSGWLGISLSILLCGGWLASKVDIRTSEMGNF